MALSDKKIIKIKTDYESGKFSKTEIGKRHKVSQPTIRKLADEGDWIFQKNFQEISKEVEEKSLLKIIEKEVDKAAKINTKYNIDIEFLNALVMDCAKDLKQARKIIKEFTKSLDEVDTEEAATVILEKKKDARVEADTIFAFLKSCKIASETINMNYSGQRKMLGMDMQADIEKARKIKGDSSTDDDRKTRFDSMSDEEIKEEKERLLNELKELDE